ncbi:hypothetical protein VTK56DRAFT_8674 [Thermocarpiscus australiensis]
MRDKTLTVVTYAAGASLAAVALIYVFGPTYFLDGYPSNSASGGFSTRKKSVVGLSNPANDCFINSVLQALAGLGDLRLYLIREIHRRSLDDESVYARLVPPGALGEEDIRGIPLHFGQDIPDWKLVGLQRGSVTRSLKEILDALNERPLYKKTISAAPFVRALEEAFRQRISRQQQDAQEFLQVVAERLCDEYRAGRRARWFARKKAAYNGASRQSPVAAEDGDSGSPPFAGVTDQTAGLALDGTVGPTGTDHEGRDDDENEWGAEEEDGFPLEGRLESQIECLTCGFKPRPTESTFCTLTLNVPRVPATTLGACFDSMFKTEYIDDFKCEKCRLLHAVAFFESEAQRSKTETARRKAQEAVERLQLAIDTNPENPPQGVELPDIRYAPKRRIARHIRLTGFPNVLAIHLSRSIFDASHFSQKNSAKVAFPEELPLGSLLRQRKYRLLGVVTHKGSHHSGHYETFRRQNIYPPFSNPSTFQVSEVYSKTPSPASTPRVKNPHQDLEDGADAAPPRHSVAPGYGTATPPPGIDLVTASTPSSRDSIRADTHDEEGLTVPKRHSQAFAPRDKDAYTISRGSADPSPRSSPQIPSNLSSRAGDPGPLNHRPRPIQPPKPKQRKHQARWWRISDDKVKEASTRDVLGMQREVYLLFYELDRSNL